ncbi:MAG: cytochrome P450, partial [Candidatus Binatia bacterium]
MELNPFSYEFHEDPHPTYRWLRENAPLYRNERMSFWVLSRFRDVAAALADWQTYSSAEGILLERMDPKMLAATPMMIFLDPPRHARLRKLVSRAFTPRRVASLEPSIRATAARLLEPLAERGGGDFVKEFSALLPAEVIFTLLGVPEADRRQAREWMDEALDRDPDTPELPSRAIAAMMNLSRYWYELVRDLRVRPNDGLVSALFEAEIETDGGGKTRLTEGELVGLCSVLAGGGNETTTRLLANAAVLFARLPEEYRKVLADPGAIPAAVEEVLRYSSPAQYAARTVTRNVEWYGTRVPKGDRILLLLGAANRDEREYPEPDRFDAGRRIPNQLAFGEGVHFCIGAPLARLESRVALEEFTRRFPRYRVDERRCHRVHMSNVHGYASVP